MLDSSLGRRKERNPRVRSVGIRPPHEMHVADPFHVRGNEGSERWNRLPTGALLMPFPWGVHLELSVAPSRGLNLH